MHYEKKFTSYEIISSKDGTKVRVNFADGSTDECDLLISAEGSYSQVNQQIGLNNIVQLTRNWGFLAKGNLPASKLRSLTPEIQKSPMACMKDRRLLFFSAYLPDAEDKTKDSTVDYDEDNASVFWGITVPVALVPAEGAKAIPDKLEFCISLLKDWDPRYHDMLRSVGDDDIYVFQARASTEPPKHWRRDLRKKTSGAGIDRIWLMGDAIHPMLPSRGMGANQAMNDTADAIAAILDLAEPAKDKKAGQTLGEGEYQKAVENYESKMMPRAFGWVRTSGGLGSDVSIFHFYFCLFEMGLIKC
jgi:2-polyprenyl-6-methoxyphenol hydroxylase-like FAD-dependent oxidoreductase